MRVQRISIWRKRRNLRGNVVALVHELLPLRLGCGVVCHAGDKAKSTPPARKQAVVPSRNLHKAFKYKVQPRAARAITGAVANNGKVVVVLPTVMKTELDFGSGPCPRYPHSRTLFKACTDGNEDCADMLSPIVEIARSWPCKKPSNVDSIVVNAPLNDSLLSDASLTTTSLYSSHVTTPPTVAMTASVTHRRVAECFITAAGLKDWRKAIGHRELSLAYYHGARGGERCNSTY